MSRRHPQLSGSAIILFPLLCLPRQSPVQYSFCKLISLSWQDFILHQLKNSFGWGEGGEEVIADFSCSLCVWPATFRGGRGEYRSKRSRSKGALAITQGKDREIERQLNLGPWSERGYGSSHKYS